MKNKKQTNKERHCEIGNKESASAVLIEEIRKSPDIAQANGIAHAAEKELEPAAPRFPLTPPNAAHFFDPLLQLARFVQLRAIRFCHVLLSVD